MIQSGQISEIPAFWVSVDRPVLKASLLFRTGIADEMLHRRGWTHMCERLALREGFPGTLQVHGSVGVLTTSFDLAGPPAQVGSALEAIAQRLGRAGYGEAEVGEELSLLASTTATRPTPSALDMALGQRFGASGAGLASIGEFGLALVDPVALRHFAAARFSTRNAVLCFDGLPPNDLRLNLGNHDVSWPPPPCRPQETTPSHGYYWHRWPGAFVSALLPALEGAPECMLGLLRRRILSGLDARRMREAVVEVSGVRVGPTECLWGLSVRARSVPAQALLSTIRGSLATLVEHGPSRQELASVIQTQQRRHPMPQGEREWPWHMAHDRLNHIEPVDLESWLQHLHEITASDIRWFAAEFRSGMDLGLPPSPGALRQESASRTVGGLPPARLPMAEPIAGASLRQSFGWGDRDGARLVQGPVGIRIERADGAMAIHWSQLASVIVPSDGTRCLVDRDGQMLTVARDEWHRGNRLIGLIDERTPPEIRVPGTEPSRDKRARFPRRILLELCRPRSWWSLTWLVCTLLAGGLVACTAALALVLGPVAEHASQWESLGSAVVALALGGYLALLAIAIVVGSATLIRRSRKWRAMPSPGRGELGANQDVAAPASGFSAGRRPLDDGAGRR